MSEKKMKVGIMTLGCRVNQYESRAISEYLQENGAQIEPFDSVCDVYIINTCAVTAESERKSRQMARRAAKLNPEASVVLTGCASQLHPKEAASLPSVIYVGGNGSKLDAARAALGLLGGRKGSPVIADMEISDSYEHYCVKVPDHTRAYVKIEDGCENRCAYCVIPSVRGPVRSKDPDEVVKEVSALAALGYKEIVLTGIETCSYQYGLTSIIKRVHDIEGVERIRLSSVNPGFISKEFADGVKDLPKFCPHFHLSLQSCCDRTLAAMNRKYSARIVEENCEYLRSVIPNICFTADVICGFPGESDADFSETLESVKRLGLLFAHVFPYSDRPGTVASLMKDKVPDEVKNTRCSVLRAAVNESRRNIIEGFIEGKTTLHALFETEKNGYLYGHTENFIEVRVKADVFADPLLSEALNEGDGNVSGGCVFAPSLLGRVFSVKLTNMSGNGKDLVVNADKI